MAHGRNYLYTDTEDRKHKMNGKKNHLNYLRKCRTSHISNWWEKHKVMKGLDVEHRHRAILPICPLNVARLLDHRSRSIYFLCLVIMHISDEISKKLVWIKSKCKCKWMKTTKAKNIPSMANTPTIYYLSMTLLALYTRGSVCYFNTSNLIGAVLQLSSLKIMCDNNRMRWQYLMHNI